jgi:hypothetical protein
MVTQLGAARSFSSAAAKPPPDYADEVSRFELGYRRSAACSAALLAMNPKDSLIRKSIQRLSVHRNEEVRAYLFAGLSDLWGIDDQFVWKCIKLVERQARIRAVYGKYWVLNRNPGVAIHWGKFAAFKKLKARVARRLQLVTVSIYKKPLRNCIYEDISVKVYQSTLYHYLCTLTELE